MTVMQMRIIKLIKMIAVKMKTATLKQTTKKLTRNKRKPRRFALQQGPHGYLSFEL